MIQLEPTPRLYILTQSGCPACEEAKPAIDKLKAEHTTEILVVELHLDWYDWNVLGWRPQETPGYALVVDGKIARKTTGAMSFRQLTAWLAGRAPQPGARPVRRRRQRREEPTNVEDDAEVEVGEGAEEEGAE
jgi:thioredoxin-like negative regulator of GroEL